MRATIDEQIEERKEYIKNCRKDSAGLQIHY